MMVVLIFYCAFSVVITGISVPVLIRLAQKKKLLDIPNSRSSHTMPTPRVGGMGIVTGTLVAWFSGCAIFNVSSDGALFYLIMVLIVAAAVGLADDLRGLKTSLRMVLYLACATGTAVLGVTVRVLYLPGLGALEVGVLCGSLFSVLFVTWYTNLFNFMDGINGIAGTAALVTMSALAFLFGNAGYTGEAGFCAAAAAACLGFLPFNFPRAKVFMGDGGAVFLGMAAGAFSIRAVQVGLISTHGVLLLMYPFVFDATFTLCRRILKKERFWAAHRSHIYQQMCDLGFTHTHVTAIYFLAAVVCALIGISYHRFSGIVRLLTVSLLIVISFGAAMIVISKNRAKKQVTAG